MAQPSLLWALQKPVRIISATHRLFSFLLPIPHWLPVLVEGWRHSIVPSTPHLSALSFLLRLDTQVLHCNVPVSTVPTCQVQYSRTVNLDAVWESDNSAVRQECFLWNALQRSFVGRYPGAFTEHTEDLQEGHVLSVYGVWAEVIRYETQHFWLFMIYTEAGYLLTLPYVEYFQ